MLTAYEKSYQAKGVNLTIKIETEYQTADEAREVLRFMADCSHNFYLELAQQQTDALNSTP